MEDKELFIQYHELKETCKYSQREYEKALAKMEECLYSALNTTNDPSKGNISTGISNKPLVYTINAEKLEKEIEIKRNIKDLDKYRLKKKLIELRESKEILDRVYVYCFVERKKPNKFYRLIPCSRSTAYNYRNEIIEKISRN